MAAVARFGEAGVECPQMAPERPALDDVALDGDVVERGADQDAVAGNRGVDVDGYRDYRGVPVVGAWAWMPQYDFGVATEVDVAEAYRPLYILRWAFWGLFGDLAKKVLGRFC